MKTIKLTLVSLATVWLAGAATDADVTRLAHDITIFTPEGLDEDPMTEPDIIWSNNDGNAWFDVDSDLIDTHKMTRDQRKAFADLVLAAQ
ncbi:hypothetical protein [Levilactobacillus lindianensis]|uniref:hypothetical protein n=1 Tax=Levilactobacillus lindianensis TaxID=2486018 RepID=UPI000F74A7DF|nr:hypothetical protein [Levilactobacillus lindianensis]